MMGGGVPTSIFKRQICVLWVRVNCGLYLVVYCGCGAGDNWKIIHAGFHNPHHHIFYERVIQFLKSSLLITILVIFIITALHNSHLFILHLSYIMH